LTADTTYTCYVVSSNAAGSTCSSTGLQLSTYKYPPPAASDLVAGAHTKTSLVFIGFTAGTVTAGVTDAAEDWSIKVRTASTNSAGIGLDTCLHDS
jgi:hypothetical protein